MTRLDALLAERYAEPTWFAAPAADPEPDNDITTARRRRHAESDANNARRESA